MSAANKLVAPGFLLFIDLLLTAAANWIYWLLISKLTTTAEVGEATTVYSLVTLIGLAVQLGLEYPLLKQPSTQRTRVLGTSVALQLILSIAALPVLIYVMNIMVIHPSLESLTGVAFGILVASSLSFVTRYILLGIFSAKNVLLIDGAGTIARFVSGYVLVSIGFGALGILLSFLIHAVLISICTLVLLIKSVRIFLRDWRC